MYFQKFQIIGCQGECGGVCGGDPGADARPQTHADRFMGGLRLCLARHLRHGGGVSADGQGRAAQQPLGQEPQACGKRCWDDEWHQAWRESGG